MPMEKISVTLIVMWGQTSLEALNKLRLTIVPRALHTCLVRLAVVAGEECAESGRVRIQYVF